jgi:MFS family permease
MLVLLRFVQEFALGGEWGGAVLLTAENSPNKSGAYWGSFPRGECRWATYLRTIVLLILSVTLTNEAFLSCGWRSHRPKAPTSRNGSPGCSTF